MVAYDGKQYFATLEPFSREFAGACFQKMESWRNWILETGLDARWGQNFCLYQGVDPKRYNSYYGKDSFRIMGDNGELLYLSFNDFRNLIQHVLNMTVDKPPNMSAKAINGEAASLIAAQTFDGVFGYYMNTYQHGRLQRETRRAVEQCLVADIGYCLVEWDPFAGETIGINPDTGAAIHAGDMYFKARGCYDVYSDPGVEDEDEVTWRCVRDQINKFELVRRFPQFEQQILNTRPAGNQTLEWRRGFSRPMDSDIIDYYKFYATPSPLAPKGRRAILLDSDTVLLDEDNPYGEIPVFPVRAMEGLWSVFGYAPANTIAPVQMAQDVITSAIITNYAMFGTQNVAVKSDDDFGIESISGGMNVLKYNTAPPSPLMLAQQADGIGDFLQLLFRRGETLSGINSVVRGDPESSLKSGKALGIVQAQAVQFQSQLAASYTQFLQNIGNFMLKVFRKYATSERVVQIIGKDQVAQSKNWSADTFGPIDRVTAELVDPAMRTLGYKTDLAMFMAQNQMTTTPQEFLTVLETGTLKPMIKAPMSELNNIHQENDDLMNGMPGQEVPVLFTDNDDLHIAEHKCLVDSPATRRDSEITQNVLMHIDAHMANKVAKAQRELLDQMAVQSVVPPPPVVEGKESSTTTPPAQ